MICIIYIYSTSRCFIIAKVAYVYTYLDISDVSSCSGVMNEVNVSRKVSANSASEKMRNIPTYEWRLA